MKIKTDCPDCQGTGLAMPRMDRPCERTDCREGQIEIEHADAEKPSFPATADGDRAAQLCDIAGGLNDWEIDFVSNFARLAKEGKHITGRQRDKADEILARPVIDQ